VGVDRARAAHQAVLRVRAPRALGAAGHAALRASGAKRVLDLGCGEGRLLSELVNDHVFTEIVGVDVSARSLEIAARRLRVERIGERQTERLRLMQGALT
jgi:ubiquinone/menaquinone biosynthesis C-methylase UbiE